MKGNMFVRAVFKVADNGKSIAVGGAKNNENFK